MKVYINDEGSLMDEDDFVPYVIWLIDQYRKEGKNWEIVLCVGFWGEQLLYPLILDKIKMQILSKPCV
jgi:hypothetical protein